MEMVCSGGRGVVEEEGLMVMALRWEKEMEMSPRRAGGAAAVAQIEMGISSAIRCRLDDGEGRPDGVR